MINNRLEINNIKYMSTKYEGIIYFNDCECFYDNLTEIIEPNEYGGRCWGQRIDIDKWRFNKSNIGILSIYLDL